PPADGGARRELRFQPALAARDVRRGRGARQLRIARRDRLVDAPVLFASLVERVVGGAAVPQPDAHRPRGKAREQRREESVAGRRRDDGVEGDIGLHELLDRVRGAHTLEDRPQLLLLARVDAAGGEGRQAPVTIRSRILSMASSVTFGGLPGRRPRRGALAVLKSLGLSPKPSVLPRGRTLGSLYQHGLARIRPSG